MNHDNLIMHRQISIQMKSKPTLKDSKCNISAEPKIDYKNTEMAYLISEIKDLRKEIEIKNSIIEKDKVEMMKIKMKFKTKSKEGIEASPRMLSDEDIDSNTELSPDHKTRILTFEFDKYLNNRDLKEEMISGRLSTKNRAVIDDLDEYGPDKFFEIIHQSENKLIMK